MQFNRPLLAFIIRRFVSGRGGLTRPELPQPNTDWVHEGQCLGQIETHGRHIDVDSAQQLRRLEREPEHSDIQRMLRVSILGAPNAGKSLLTNALIGASVSPVSSKVHTTKRVTRGVICEGDTQLVVSSVLCLLVCTVDAW